ncbi:methyl-CpG-binding domain protein 1b isoform X2 [Periophthalmus magnuspinnatus]|uniref:methyl-CpG-binding domain protein 1b isoform X2 n=1 Tax=Periophthalmus magnuspinnatus TaxID=409849 RepID=UPI0024363621|nr:methyl-CpG-binding domain protein 1b isoform X2 [Periophthalmus magnuspinnatus]
MEEEQPKSPAHERDEHANKQGEPWPETDTQVSSTDTKTEAVEVKSEETKEPMDWFEPLEDDDDDEDANSFEFPTEQHAFGLQDPEEESLAGESERSGSVAGSEKGRRIYKRARRKRNYDEGWIECPSLGEGWKRKESIRQSGTRSGQSDVYYMSPQGERARSRIELSIMMNRDLSSFEFKTGVFRKNGQQRLTLQRRKRKPREHSSSDSSFVERGEGADTPDSLHRLTPTVSSIPVTFYQATFATNNATKPQIKQEFTTSCPKDETMKPPDGKIKLPGPTSSKPLSFPSINGEFGPDDSILVCSRCGLTFTGTWYDKQRKRPLCPSCWALKTKEHPLIRFRKGPGGFVMPKPKTEPPDSTQDIPYYQHLNVKSSDTENLTNLDLDEDDDESTDDDDDRKRRKRRSCGECPACLYSTDCGTCDFCIDKPKFGGSNKKRQKCRLRQCQRQAMRHLLPSQLGPEADGISIVGRAKPQYTYSRKRKRAPPSEDEDDDRNQQAIWSSENASGSKISYKQNFRKHPSPIQLNNSVYEEQNGVFPHIYDSVSLMESRSQFTSNFQKHVEVNEDDYPTITQIYSLTDETEQSDLNQEQDLMKLLNSLRSSALPILWYAIMAEGPQMQLVQCSKQSVMADTIVQIDTDFNYKISVQRHPLLPTHPLYDAHPSRLNSVTHVVNLLLDMDKYIVCHGVPPIEEVLSRTPVILERAPTCEFLIKKNETICRNCRELCE